MAITRIYREDLPRVTASRNQLGISLLKRIRHGLVAKINNKKRSQTCEVFGRILADYSRARCAPTPIASPRPAPAPPRPGGVRRVSARVCFPLSPLLHTLVSV
jgi:hypothetical protein